MNNYKKFFKENKKIILIVFGVVGIITLISILCLIFVPMFNNSSNNNSSNKKSLLVETVLSISSTTSENYDGNITSLDQIPNESNIKEKQKFFSDFLNIYCNVNGDDILKKKSEQLILKMYNFFNMKKDNMDNVYYEIIEDDTTGMFFPGKKKGDKMYYYQIDSDVLNILIYIVYPSSKFKIEDKKEILASSLTLLMSTKSRVGVKYNSSDNTFDIEPTSIFSTNFQLPSKMSYNDFRDSLYQIVNYD